MTAGPLPGPASAYPTFSRPASICLSGANVFVLGPAMLAGAEFVLGGCASAEPIMPNWAAATVMAAAPKKRRRSWLISFDILRVFILEALFFDSWPVGAA